MLYVPALTGFKQTGFTLDDGTVVITLDKNVNDPFNKFVLPMTKYWKDEDANDGTFITVVKHWETKIHFHGCRLGNAAQYSEAFTLTCDEIKSNADTINFYTKYQAVLKFIIREDYPRLERDTLLAQNKMLTTQLDRAREQLKGLAKGDLFQHY